MRWQIGCAQVPAWALWKRKILFLALGIKTYLPTRPYTDRAIPPLRQVTMNGVASKRNSSVLRYYEEFL
jgi:hypothetical protein